jgi:hypothetical protein
MVRDPPAGSVSHNAYLIGFDTQGSTSTKRLSEDIVDAARPAKVPRLTETCTFFMLNKELTSHHSSLASSSRPKSSYDITPTHQDLMLIRNPRTEENTHRQRGSKLVFDGVELPSIRRISARQTRPGGDEDVDENMEIEIGSNHSATGSFYIPPGSHNNGTKTPAGRNARRIAKQRKAVIPDSDLESLAEQPFAREGESSSSRGTSPLPYCTVR